LGPPPAPVAVARTVLAPARRFAVMVTVAQVVQAPVALNACPAATTEPLTAMSIGRLAAWPLAYRIASVAGPAAAASTVHSTALPEALL